MQMEGMVGGTYYGLLSASDFDFNNITQVKTFLHDLKHQEYLPILGARYARYFWYGIIVVVGLTASINRTWSIVRSTRHRAVQTRKPSLQKLYSTSSTILATTTALVREPSYLQWTPRALSPWLKVPPFGPIYVILAYFAFIIALEFINNDVPEAGHWQFLGDRAGWLAAAQVPLLVALAGKRNFIGMLCGITYVRLNIYHRWVSRGLLLLSTFHFAFQNHGWDLYNISKLEWTTDDCPTKGIAAYAFILWMNLTTLAPFRNMCYELFVVQHIITFFGFIISLSYHLDLGPAPASQRYIWASAGIYIAALLLRFIFYIYSNVRPAHATLEAVEGGATKIRVTSKQIRSWTPGAHILLSLPRVGLQLSHPATILSTPSSHDGDLVLILKSHKGFTRTLNKKAHVIPSEAKEKDIESPTNRRTYLALFDGPYGSSAPDFTTFDSVLFISGGTGVTFTLSQLLAVAHRSTDETLPLRKVSFIWVVKGRQWLSWIMDELQIAMQKIKTTNIELQVKIFITCDSEWFEETTPDEKQGCCCSGVCRCCGGGGDDDEDQITRIPSSSSTEKPKPGQTPTKDTTLFLDTPGIGYQQGRPSFDDYIEDAVLQAGGEIAVAACGPIGLTVAVRQSVVKISDRLGVCKGSGLPGVFLHVENSY
ncbi:metalloreductase [Aspergillus ellipticus CBS 707.79]|uniref:Metalloreductase n=1 Tax=Aspergillus ellipticus CBS 707.79 TaxID=1448320 RepID=A0A319D858_9EURO|nr:metalloreductase [Aspergillus ellipticus CBS 707.79]